MGGEKVWSRPSGSSATGSPPHRRGKAFSVLRRQFRFRITPAQAGKRGSGLLFHRVWWDHPRVGGEKLKHPKYTTDKGGSPPHGRGKAARGSRPCAGQRITPAWAGKSSRAPWAISPARDHPRMGGEKPHIVPAKTSLTGSPPRGRGKSFLLLLLALRLRITPAWAGKRSSSSMFCLTSRDHPRMGGEKLLSQPAACIYTGSPPRGRGKESETFFGLVSHRITPAWAGKSPASQPWSPPLWMMVIRPRP